MFMNFNYRNLEPGTCHERLRICAPSSVEQLCRCNKISVPWFSVQRSKVKFTLKVEVTILIHALETSLWHMKENLKTSQYRTCTVR